MANFKLDRFKFNWKNNWVANTSYKKDDIVNYRGKSYVCLKGHTSSNNFYNDLDADAITQSFTVTVGTDTLNSQSQGKFYINGIENPELVLLKGRTYEFNCDNTTLLTFGDIETPFLISTVSDGTNNGGQIYSENVVYKINGQIVTQQEYLALFGTANTRRIELSVPDNNTVKLHYFSTTKKSMGASFSSDYNSFWELMTDGFSWQGDWQSQRFYSVGSIIKWKSYLYRCLESHTSTIVVNLGPIADLDKWELLATGSNWLGNWTPSTSYDLGDVVLYGGEPYICITKHTSADTVEAGLEDDLSSWNKFNNTVNWLYDWQISTRYTINDIVKYGGIVYRCTTPHVSNSDADLGLEADQSSWAILIDGIEFLGDWQASYRYKKNDIVKSGPTLFKAKAEHTSGNVFTLDNAEWDIYIPGLEYERLWNESENYQVGDIVLYGGYSYVALQNNSSSVPSINGILQDTGNWELLTTGFNFRGEYNRENEYLTGDTVRYSGNVYVAILDKPQGVDTNPNDNPNTWRLIIEGDQFRGDWIDNTEYYVGDIVTRAGTTYICIENHLSTASGSRPDLDQDYTQENFWIILIQGNPDNVLTDLGDISSFDTTDVKIGIGSTGKVLKTSNSFPGWLGYDEIPKVYYVGPNGVDDEGFGLSVNAPFASVAYACTYISQDTATRTPATIFIKTGVYRENLPISVPRDTALVGDELRSTMIMPAEGQETSDMFYVNNGSGIRNMTLAGLTGQLGPQNQFLTRRPTAGAYVSLDPGTGPDDTSVHITSKSPYIQNVTTFGTGCIGMKVDGALHNSGNRSIVANDFTQVLSDGIGYWADNVGRSELVSVFTYYCHIGYLCTNGGILRATNGNNSYGEYGSVAEGFDSTETPLSATVNNRDNEAQFEQGFTYGTTEQEILAIGYSNAGREYSSANITFGGSGLGASANYTEFRDNAISAIRSISTDSSIPGGLNYTFVANNAQSGNQNQIQLAQADINTELDYVGQRIVITSGVGVGQYAEITGYDELTKVAIVSKETDGTAGWEHFQPGWPIENTLDETTRYVIEPRVSFAEPTFNVQPTSFFISNDDDWESAITNNSDLLLVAAQTTGTWSIHDLQGTTRYHDGQWAPDLTLGNLVGVAWTGARFVVAWETGYVSLLATTSTLATIIGTYSISGVASDGNGNIIWSGTSGTVLIRSNHGSTLVGSTAVGVAGKMSYGNGKWVIVGNNGDVAVSTDTGATWTVTSSAVTATTWSEVVYGNNRFLAVSSAGNRVARSFDGINWYETFIPVDEDLNKISYGQGLFVASGGATKLATSKGGDVWKTIDDTSTAYTTSGTGTWRGSVNIPSQGNWLLVQANSNDFNLINASTQPLVRAKVESTRITGFTIYDSGANLGTPSLTITDNSNTSDVLYNIFVSSGVLSQPEYANRGTGYVTLTAQITGDGFAEIFQTGSILKVSNLTDIPGPGANLNIDGIDDRQYSVVRVNSFTGTGPYEAVLAITPSLGIEESPIQGTELSIRERYSQVRLTGHDFLDIGTGNENSTRYPQLYLEGESPANARQPFNETVASGGGRVFYTSTDQDGNFRVGELFEVEQATGIVSINASQFNLSGLTELSLGGIQVGGSAVVIREFSKDPTFLADSNNIVPTQAAIKAYVESRISGGGSNANTNTLVAGQIQVTSTNISTTSGLAIDIPVVAKLKKGATGKYLALQYYAAAG